MHASPRLLVLLAFGAAGCIVALPPAQNEPAPPGPRTERVPVAPAPVEPEPVAPATSASCEVAFRTSAAPSTDGRSHLLVTAVNLTDHAIMTTQTARCPGPAARFEGLPPGYDVGETCAMGACVEPTTRTELSLAPGEARVIAEVAIATLGDSCNAALPAGNHTVFGAASLAGVSTCVTQRATIHVAPPPNPQPEPPTTRDPHERCPPVACAYRACPPGRSPPPGCAGQCGCH